MFRLGLIINPFAGIGGRVGLKGSDGADVRRIALQLGAPQLARTKVKNCLIQFKNRFDKITIITVSGEMGEQVCSELGLTYEIASFCKTPSTDLDTKEAVKAIQDSNIDLLLFAGGDGTARNIFEVSDQCNPVLGIPAGVKIHSGVYAVSAEAAGLLVNDLVDGKMLSLVSADVVDIDEQAFRQGKVKAQKYGELNVPASLRYVQAVKNGNSEIEELVFQDIAAEVIESMDDNIYYVIGSGTTCAEIMRQLGLTNTLLGSDIVHQESLIKSDAVESDLLALIESGAEVIFVITVIGGQGHILGRGNHQLSPQVVKSVGWDCFVVIATKSKLEELNNRPLLVDTGDIELDHALHGLKQVICGYRDYVLYPVGLKRD
ncbi:MAG: ATP-NAD kinase family protein [Kangiellaceae bacterium]|nr:ATP-NAD kinase family protein [Kangiellaceae bacterium]